jgi:hypothetical protein
MASRLPNGQYILARNSNHWIMQEETSLVIQAIAHVAEAVSASASA